MMKFEQIAASIFEVLTVIGAVIGGICVASSFAPAVSAPQGSEIVAIGIAFTDIPYCVAGIFHRGAVRGLLGRDRL
jgi:hypothetical protein